MGHETLDPSTANVGQQTPVAAKRNGQNIAYRQPAHCLSGYRLGLRPPDPVRVLVLRDFGPLLARFWAQTGTCCIRPIQTF